MPLSADELRLLDAACGSRDNEAARVLQNAFGMTAARDIMVQIATSPVTVRSDFMDQVRLAIDEQKRRRTC
jgi:hypothetical protein